jgi:TRAP transporter 4TM/12TM fusion protein
LLVNDHGGKSTVTENIFFRIFITIWSTCFVLFHLYTATFGVFIAQLQRPLHLTFAAVFGFLVLPAIKSKKLDVSNIILAALCIIVFGYNVYNYHDITMRQILVDPLTLFEYAVGGISLLLVLELTRRAVGGALVYVAAGTLAYAFVGPYLPGVIAHRGFVLTDVIDYLCFGLDGVYGLPIGISATYVILFIILGTFMEFTGVGDLIMDLGKLLVGQYRGGAAKIAALSSAMVGSISGSAVANVYATGAITIPMMKRIGYKPHIAGAVEAVASTGGQIMPPVMGAAAFLMAEVLGMPYLKICKAALIPAILYFTCLILVLDYEAAKTGIKGIPKKDLPTWREVLPRFYLLTPIISLVVVLFMGYTAMRAALAAILVCIALSFLRKDTRFTWKTFFDAMIVSAKRGVMIAGATAAAGIVIGIISLTGVGITFSSLVMSLSYGIMALGLILIMIACIIMGMGTPTTVAYIIVVTLAAPAMIDFGFSQLASHMFVFYFGVMSMITPPVEVAAYAAADISKADPIKIGFTACRIAILAFIMPYVFLFEPALLMQGSWWTIISTFAMTLIAVVILAGTITGWFFIKLKLIWRFVFLVIFILIIIPELISSIIGVGLALTATFAFYVNSKAKEREADGKQLNLGWK